MATDVRALLKAKTQARSKRIEHPFAAYNASGQLRCSLCAVVVKDNEISWSGHLGSKGHRTNVGRQKEAEKKEEERARLAKGKRKALAEEDPSDGDEDAMDTQTGKDISSKRQRTEEPPAQNFFSDPSRTLPANANSDDDENGKPVPASSTNKQMSQIDLEWAQFERDVLAPRVSASQTSGNPDDPPLSKQDIFDRATVAVSEEITYDRDEGFPAHLQQGAPAAGRGARIDGEYVGGKPVEDETPQQAAERKANEEKELIMDRILDEERAQEDADEKVRAMKARLALIRKKREESKKK